MKWFEIGLVVLTLATGIIWLLDRLVFAKRRAERAGLLEDKEPVVVDYAKAFFPVLAVVLILRSFVAEPFRIPSSSMMPTLLIGDFILVNKFSYGLRLPITNQKVISIGEPQRGDVVVFRPPQHPDQDWIKRVVGVPGDVDPRDIAADLVEHGCRLRHVFLLVCGRARPGGQRVQVLPGGEPLGLTNDRLSSRGQSKRGARWH